jgi:ribosomal protein L7/L12
MINLQLSVREAMELSFYAREDIRERITQAFEMALGVNQRCTVTITNGMTLDNRIHCIKAIRLHTGWGLKESKDWTDVLVGGWKNDRFVPAKNGIKQSITLKTPEAAENLLRDLADLGCEGYLS